MRVLHVCKELLYVNLLFALTSHISHLPPLLLTLSFFIVCSTELLFLFISLIDSYYLCEVSFLLFSPFDLIYGSLNCNIITTTIPRSMIASFQLLSEYFHTPFLFTSFCAFLVVIIHYYYILHSKQQVLGAVFMRTMVAESFS